jgi:ADP-heptose:LPS heptosyltransferase
MIKRIARKILPNPLNVLLKRAVRKKHEKFLIAWNRGLGDIPLGLYALVYKIKSMIPSADITFMTRADLQEGFSLLQGVKVISCADWKRKGYVNLASSIASSGFSSSYWDVIIDKPDPTYWLKWQIGRLTPKLYWDPQWDELSQDMQLDQNEQYIGVHIDCETQYGYEKNWPKDFFVQLFQKLRCHSSKKIILFGVRSSCDFSFDHVIDLRGKTTLKQMLAIIKNRCSHLLAPDSGVLSITYYLDASFHLHVISLWADPMQGVLKQAVSSPNPLLIHTPLIAKDCDLKTISVSQVFQVLLASERDR